MTTKNHIDLSCEIGSTVIPNELPTTPVWRAHAALFCATVGGFCNLYAMQALVPALTMRFHMGVGGAASLLTATTLGLTVCAPIAGRVASRLGARRAVLIALCGLACITFGIGFAHETLILLILRLLQGFLIPVALSALLSSTGTMWPGVVPASLAATYVTGTILGGLVGRLLPAALMPFGWTVAFTWFAMAQLGASAAVMWLFPSASAAGAQPIEIPLRRWIAQILPTVTRDIPLVAIGAFVLMFSQSAITTFAAVRLAAAPYHWSTTKLGALYLVFLPALAFVRLTPIGIVRNGAAWTLTVAAVTSWLGLVMTVFGNVVPILVGLAIFSACVFVVQTVLAHLLGVANVQNRELAGGSYLAIYYSAASLGAIAPVAVWHSQGWLGCLELVASIQLLGLVLALRLRRDPSESVAI